MAHARACQPSSSSRDMQSRAPGPGSERTCSTCSRPRRATAGPPTRRSPQPRVSGAARPPATSRRLLRRAVACSGASSASSSGASSSSAFTSSSTATARLCRVGRARVVLGLGGRAFAHAQGRSLLRSTPSVLLSLSWQGIEQSRLLGQTRNDHCLLQQRSRLCCSNAAHADSKHVASRTVEGCCCPDSACSILPAGGMQGVAQHLRRPAPGWCAGSRRAKRP